MRKEKSTFEANPKAIDEAPPCQVKLSFAAIITILVVCSATSFVIGYTASQDFLVAIGWSNEIDRDANVNITAPSSIPEGYTRDRKLVKYHNIAEPHQIHTVDNALNEINIDVNGDTVSQGRLLNTKMNFSVTINKLIESNTEKENPVAHQILMDIEGIDADMLRSVERMVQIGLDMAVAGNFDVLSSRCHGLDPDGVICVAILSDGRISLYSHPSSGSMSLDLFTRSQIVMSDLKPKVEKILGLPQTKEDDLLKMKMKWAYKQRGFFLDEKAYDGLDLGRLLGWRAFFKRRIASFKTSFQTIDIYDKINGKKYRGLLEGRTASRNIEDLVKKITPDRLVFSNGVLQSRLFGEAAYHEALVHPALISHPDPKRVAIIGGVEGATLREVLKHRTVETVAMIEMDEGMVNASRLFLPQWSDCSNLLESANSCFDDPRTELYFTDAAAWFVDRFSSMDKIDEEEKYDVIIMDSFDPLTEAGFPDILKNFEHFVGAIFNALTDDGVFVSQIGEDEDMRDYPEDILSEKSFIRQLIKHGFQSIRDYSEGKAGLGGVWSFRVAFKSTDSKTLWYQNQVEIDCRLKHRAMKTKDGNDPFRIFDGATMMTYQYPSRTNENVFCRSEPTPDLCENGHGFDPYIANIYIDDLEVKLSEIPGAGRGLFFKKNFPAGSYIAIDEGSQDIVFMPMTTWLLKEIIEQGVSDKWKVFDYYTFGYGFSNDFYGDAGFSVDPSIMTFINHGCNGTYNMGTVTSVTELDADPIDFPPELLNYILETTVYSPFIDRNNLVYLNGHDFLRRDVLKGEELKDNYLSYLNEYNWQSGLADYKAQCLRQASGAITEYERQHNEAAQL